MNGWKDAGVDGWMNGWMDGWMDGEINIFENKNMYINDVGKQATA